MIRVAVIGTNNIGRNADEKPEWAANGIKKIVETVHEKLPNTKVLLLAVFPRSTNGSPERQKIDEMTGVVPQLVANPYSLRPLHDQRRGDAPFVDPGFVQPERSVGATRPTRSFPEMWERPSIPPSETLPPAISRPNRPPARPPLPASRQGISIFGLLA